MIAPKEVQGTFERLRLEYSFYIVLVKLNGKFYVYRSKSFWNKEMRKVQSKTTYLGRIKEDGTFVKKIKQNGTGENVIAPKAPTKLSPADMTILRYLSMNCRIPIQRIAKAAGLSIAATEHRKKTLEKKFDIRYFSSINYTKLGFSAYLALIKFERDVPPIEDIRTVFEKEPRVQLVMMAQGDYNVVAYILAENNLTLSKVLFNMRKDERISQYYSLWNVIAVDESYGYVPLRDSFFEVVKNSVWKRTKNGIKPSVDSIKQREYLLLRALNSDGNVSFAEIERKCGFGHGAGKYIFDKLKEKKILLGETMTMRNCNIRYNAIMFVDVVENSAFINDRKKFIEYIMKDYDAPINRFMFVGDTASPDGIICILPIFKEGELEAELEWLKGHIGGIRLKPLVLTQTILGELCYRKLDNNYAQQSVVLKKDYKLNPIEDIIDYASN